MKKWQRAAGALGAIVAVGTVGMLADSIVAIGAERRISTAAAETSNLEAPPRVTLGGLPYSWALVSGEIPTLSVEALDVDTPGFGLVTARTELSNIEVTDEQVLSGNITGSTAEVFTRQLGLDAVAVGEQLGITDLIIANPYDISPTGGAQAEVQLTGTPPGLDGIDEPVTVVAALRLDGAEFSMRPIEFVDVPAGREEEVGAKFTWVLDTRSLPLSSQAEAVYVSGGLIFFQATRRNVTVTLSDLSPLETSRESDYDATDYGRAVPKGDGERAE